MGELESIAMSNESGIVPVVDMNVVVPVVVESTGSSTLPRRTVSLHSTPWKSNENTSLGRPPLSNHHSWTAAFSKFSNRNLEIRRKSADEPLPLQIEYARLILQREKRKSALGVFVPARFSEDVQDLLVRQSKTLITQNDDVSTRLNDIKKKAVSFNEVEIREYPIIVGDHPGGARGVPLTIGWEVINLMSWDLEQYEDARAQHRRTMNQMRITSSHRQTILKDWGFTRQEMMWGLKSANVVRNQRRKTNELQHMDRIHERLEMVRRKLQTIATFGRRKRAEKKFLSRHVPARAVKGKCSSSPVSPPTDLSASSNSLKTLGSLPSTHHVRADLTLGCVRNGH